MADLNGMTRDELLILQSDIKVRLKKFKPFKIKEVYRSCNRPECYCSNGIDLHGPYLYISWREDNKTKTRSLGRKYEQSDIEEMAYAPSPILKDYFKINPAQYKKLNRVDRDQLWKYELSDYQFEERYSVSKEDDKIGMYDHFYGTKDSYDQYFIDCDLVEEARTKIPNSSYAYLGVGTLDALAVIARLESKNYYFKE